MSDDDGFWSALKAHKKEKFDSDRANFLQEAVERDDGGWTKHTQWHWSRMINGERLDYWPSRKKFMWRGKVMRGLKAMGKIKGEKILGNNVHFVIVDEIEKEKNNA